VTSARARTVVRLLELERRDECIATSSTASSCASSGRGESDRVDQLLDWSRESIHIIYGTRVLKSLFWGGLTVVLAREVISSKRQ